MILCSIYLNTCSFLIKYSYDREIALETLTQERKTKLQILWKIFTESTSYIDYQIICERKIQISVYWLPLYSKRNSLVFNGL